MALLKKQSFRNGTAEWFGRYEDRKMFRSLGYTSPMSELLDDEAEWFKAIEWAYSKAQALMKKMKGGGRG